MRYQDKESTYWLKLKIELTIKVTNKKLLNTESKSIIHTMRNTWLYRIAQQRSKASDMLHVEKRKTPRVLGGGIIFALPRYIAAALWAKHDRNEEGRYYVKYIRKLSLVYIFYLRMALRGYIASRI